MSIIDSRLTILTAFTPIITGQGTVSNVSFFYKKVGVSNTTSASGRDVGSYTAVNVTQYGPLVTAIGTSSTLIYLGNNPSGGAGTRLIDSANSTNLWFTNYFGTIYSSDSRLVIRMKHV